MADKTKKFLKKGWHPEESGGIRKQVGGLLPGRSKTDAQSARAQSHQSKPMAALQDPDSFGPPPKNRQFHPPEVGEAPVGPTPKATGFSSRPEQIAPVTSEAPEEAEVVQPVRRQPPAVTPRPTISSRAPRSEERVTSPKPYVQDTSGLSVAGLPPPPSHKDRPSIARLGSSQRDPTRDVTRPAVATNLRTTAAQPAAEATPPKPKPRLPPRLPPRTASAPRVDPPEYSPEGYDNAGVLSQTSTSNLANAGISVPGFGITPSSSRAPAPIPRPFSPPKPASQLSELQARFSRQALSPKPASSPAFASPLTTTTAASPTASSQGTTWQQKQAALKTASAFNKDPSSISLSEARQAGSVANNFRERHGEQVKGGYQAANGVNQKYGIMNKIGGLSNRHPGGSGESGAAGEGEQSAAVGSSASARAPPPPVPRKRVPVPGVGGSEAGDGPPPPVPLASRPR